jgi:hypothetical protein
MTLTKSNIAKTIHSHYGFSMLAMVKNKRQKESKIPSDWGKFDAGCEKGRDFQMF